MKKSKWILFTACVLTISCMLASCETAYLPLNSSTTTPTPTTTTSTEKTKKPAPNLNFNTSAVIRNEPKPEDMPHNEQLLLGGINISSFRIVYGASPLTQKISNTGRTIAADILPYLQGENKDCKFDYESAVRLQALIKELFGYDVEIIDSSKAANDISNYEIVLGDATSRDSRNRTVEGLRDDKYVCKFNIAMSNLPYHYIVAGGSYGATWHAIDAIEQYLRDELAKDPNAVIDIGKDLDLSGSYEFKTVACIGDSITRGSQAFPQDNGYGNASGLAAKWGGTATSVYFEQYFSYPSVLQRELWKDHLVYNFGVGATTMRNYPEHDSNKPYATKGKLNQALELSDQADFDFDLVLIMLGTNDSGRANVEVEYDAAYNVTRTYWNDEDVADFKKETKFLMDEILEGSPNAQFVLMNAPHRCNTYTGTLGTVQKDAETGAIDIDPDTSKPKFTVSGLGKDIAVRDVQLKVATQLKAEGYNVLHYNMEAYTRIEMSKNGVCGSDRSSELKAHENYYNIKTDTGTPDTTHPNYRGYGKIAEGMQDLLDYLLHNGEKPVYMIDLP